jgi:hypothetical protein
MRRKLPLLALAGTILLASIVAWQITPTTAQQRPEADHRPIKTPASPLPMSQVILFSSGVGYFQREGEVEGNARIDLSFPATDINDLLKSLVLQDLNGGKISTINYDSPDPIDRTLRSFALDLTSNPTFGQILNQARGQKIELTLQQGNNLQPSTLTGVIVGMETRKGTPAEGEFDVLNLSCTRGLCSVPIAQIQSVRFLNPTLDGEFKRALEVLAAAHDTQKKMVSLDFQGEGKRTVRVGYVVENPIWKTSYRLVLDKKGKCSLQGWAVVENTTDEDWNQVRMALIAGRPISFEMNLYQPLYIPRPLVEPELFASLRPPTYSGSLTAAGMQGGGGQNNLGGTGGGPGFGGGFSGGFGGGTPGNRYQPGGGSPVAQGGLGALGGLGARGGGGLMGRPPAFNPAGQPAAADREEEADKPTSRLTYEQLQERRKQQREARAKAKKIGSALAEMDPTQSITSAAFAEDMGNACQYVIQQHVSLARQKSALLPIINQPVEASKVSIFNEGIHDKYPLLGLKFKNTSHQHLMQGPITVYEGGSYAGDARLLDIQPNEERLLSYAIDLGVEVKAEVADRPEELVALKIVKGDLHTTDKVRETKTYLIKNRSEQDRVLLVEHTIRADWNLVSPKEPSERSREVYRFQLPVPAGKAVKHEVVEDKTIRSVSAFDHTGDKQIRRFLNSPITSLKVKEALRKTIDLHTGVSNAHRERTQTEQQLKAIMEDQTRMRANLDKLPPTSAVYKRYLEKFDMQETEIEKLQKQIKQLQETEKKLQTEYENYLTGLTVE